MDKDMTPLASYVATHPELGKYVEIKQVRNRHEAIGRISIVDAHFKGNYSQLVRTLEKIDYEGKCLADYLGGPVLVRDKPVYRIFQSPLKDHGQNTTEIRFTLDRL
ncbi:MAG: hypothetical protein ACP5D2_00765 [Candidatus Nanoarchaeia archaeon]